MTTFRSLALRALGIPMALAVTSAATAQDNPDSAGTARVVDASGQGTVPSEQPSDTLPSRGVRWLTGEEPFAPLIADPKETQIRGSIITVSRDLAAFPDADSADVAGFDENDVEAEVVLGLRQPVVSFQREAPGRPAIMIAFEVGVFNRFFLQTPQADFVSADFRVGFPIEIAYDGWEGRLEPYHMSSHFGDDFVARFDIVNRTITQDGIQLLLARRLIPPVRLYVGGIYNFHTNEDVEETSAQWGIEWDASVVEPEGGIWPLVASNFEITDLTDRVSGTIEAGATFRVSGVGLQLALRGHFGTSTVGKLRAIDEDFFGLGLRIIP